MLKPDGYALITCPDLQSVAALVAEDKLDDTAYVSPAGPITPIDMLYGMSSALARGKIYMAHRTGFTATTLGNALIDSGFTRAIVERDEKVFALWSIGFKADQSDAQLKDYRDSLFPPAGVRR